MRRNNTPPRATAQRHAANFAVVGLALINAASVQARTRPIEGVRLAESAQPASSGDSYQDGRAMLAAGNIPAAVAAFRSALVSAPQSIDALNGLAVAYDRMGRYDVSRSYYDAALAIDPNAALVLNNLGYSLYLQGNYQAAIPLLQRAMDSNDSAARSTGQRVLNLVAARMRADAAAASTAIAVAEIQQPRARIEQSVSGEQRLVLAAPAPDAALVASLGDDAALVMVAKPWTPREEAALAKKQAAADRAVAATQLASALAAARPAASPITAPPSAAHPAIPAPAAPAPTAPAPAQSVAALAARPFDRAATPAATPEALAFVAESTPARGAITADTAARIAAAARARLDAVLTASLDTITAATDAVDAAADAAARHAADREPRRARRALVRADPAIKQDGVNVDPAPAWLLAARRDPRNSDAPAAVRDETHGDDANVAFDSDDGDLNAFAARMRGVEPPAVVSTEDAVARLESLLRRLRTA